MAQAADDRNEKFPASNERIAQLEPAGVIEASEAAGTRRPAIAVRSIVPQALNHRRPVDVPGFGRALIALLWAGAR